MHKDCVESETQKAKLLEIHVVVSCLCQNIAKDIFKEISFLFIIH